MIKKSTLYLFLTLSFIIILIPIVFYIFQFHSSKLSNELNDWSAFGTYIGGVLTPIISAITVLILGYLTYFVGKNSTEENKNLFIQQKKVEAYDKLTSLLVPFQLTIDKLSTKVERFNVDLAKATPENLGEIYDKLEEINNVAIFYAEFHLNFYNFRIRYSHLFSYDFESDEYKSLLDCTSKIKNNMQSFYIGVLREDLKFVQEHMLDLKNNFSEINNLMGTVLGKLQDEINI